MLSNGALAELLARDAETAEGIRRRALRRAARSAFLWPEAASDLLRAERSLTELHSVGPFIAERLKGWLESSSRRVTPPPLRRDFLTLAEARALLRKKPDWEKRLRGDLQMHTTWSDGSGTVAAMAAAATERGYRYIGITDHSKGLKIAGGIDEEALRRQGDEIEAWNNSSAGGDGSVQVLRSIEMNINPRGEGDMEGEALDRLDLVLGSFHSALRTKEEQTPRYLAALRNPHLQILGHPRGRIYNYRLGLSADWARVFAEAARLGKAVEIDCYPDRQDLNRTLLKIAREAGVFVSLGTDAHHPWQLGFIELGIAAALQAKIPAEKIINFLSLEKLKQWVAQVRAQTSKGKR